MGTYPSGHPERFWRRFWGMAFLTGAIVDVWRMKHHDQTTLSETIRHTFHTDTPEGKLLFLATLGILAVHILANKP